MEKQEAVINILTQKNADALLLTSEVNMHYFCGFSPSEGMVLLTADAGYHIVDSRYFQGITANVFAVTDAVERRVCESVKDNIFCCIVGFFGIFQCVGQYFTVQSGGNGLIFRGIRIDDQRSVFRKQFRI